MTRTIKVLSTLALGGMLFGITACEDTVCKEALAKATAATADVQKTVSSQAAGISGLRAKLAAADQATAAAKKALEEARPLGQACRARRSGREGRQGQEEVSCAFVERERRGRHRVACTPFLTLPALDIRK